MYTCICNDDFFTGRQTFGPTSRDLQGRLGVFWGFYAALSEFQPYRDLKLGIPVVEKHGLESRTPCSASQELNHNTTAAPPPRYIKPWHNET